MNQLYDTDKLPPTAEELNYAIQDARVFLHLWTKRALCATSAFVRSCAAVSLCLDGHPLHEYWASPAQG